ncbi:MAG: 2-amino-4-hydroxy-6-hydroxymethyldihydropteridine diphosphokinase [Thermoleophilia bacterium]
MDVRAFVGLGANLGDREATLRAGLERLAAEPGIRVVAVSSFLETEPWGFLDQPGFVNAACELATSLAPHELLRRLLAIEAELGRTRDGPRWGPRTLDLDLLLYGDETIDDPPVLEVPHPRLVERRFAVEPLVELDPGLRLPDGRALTDVLAELE